MVADTPYYVSLPQSLSANSHTSELISDFMMRPITLLSGSWTTSSISGVQLFSTGILPAIVAKPLWTNKIYAYLHWRGTAVVTVQLNANPFQQGKLLLHYLPCANAFGLAGATGTRWVSGHNYELASRTMHPCVDLDCRDTSATLKIPYVSTTEWCDWQAQAFDWGNFYLDVLAPLKTGSSGPQSVEYTVWLHFEGFEVSTPILPQSGVQSAPRGKFPSTKGKRMKASREETIGQQESKALVSGSLSSALSSVSVVSKELSGVPLLSSFATSVSWASSVAAGLASSLGWSKPNNENPISYHIQRPFNRLTNDDGQSNSEFLAMSSTNRVAALPGFAGRDIDEMSFAFLKSVSCYQATSSWTTSNLPGVTIYLQDIIPNDVGVTNNIVTNSNVYYYRVQCPAFHLSHYFRYWRGTIKLHVKISKTDFHSGRLLVTYSPRVTTTYGSNVDSAYLLREILDIRTSNYFELDLPYLWNANYAPCDSYVGTVCISVLNTLTCPETASSSIDILTYYSVCEDFELQVPNQASVYPIAPQSGVSKSQLLDKSTIGNAVCPSFSVDHSQYCIGECFMSIKQLLSRSSRVYTGSTNTYSTTATIWPYFCGVMTNSSTYTTGNPPIGGDYYSHFANGYLLARGGFRMTIGAGTDGSKAATYVVQQCIGPAQPVMSSTAIASTVSVNSIIYMQNPLTVTGYPFVETTAFFPLGIGGMDISIPQYSPTPSRFIQFQVFDTQIAPTVDISQPQNYLSWLTESHSGFTNNYPLYRAASEDTQLGFFIGFLPLCTGTVMVN